MAATGSSTTHRYAESLSSSDRFSPCSARRDSGKNLSLVRHFVANSNGRRTPSDLVAVPASPAAENSSRALVKARDAKGGLTFGSMVKKLMEKRPNSKPGSAGRAVLVVPPDPIAEDLKKGAAKGSHLSALSRKLYQKGRSGERTAKNALTDVKANTRTLAMVLRSERELLAQNKEYEEQISELRLLVEEKNREVEKLKDLCLRQREEIKALKDVILFPDVMNSQLQELLEKQGFELKQAKQVIPSLQNQVTSLTGQLQCLAEDLAEVKADKYPTRICFDGQLSSPRTPIFNQEPANSLEYSSGDHRTSQFGSPDEMFLRDLNPCLTPCFPKSKPQDNNQLVYDSPKNESLFLYNTQLSPNTICGSTGRTFSKSLENRQRLNLGSISAQKVYKSYENKLSIGKPRYHNLF